MNNQPNLSALKTKAQALSGREREIADALLTACTTAANPDPAAIRTALGWMDGMTLTEIFREGSELHHAVAALIGEENAVRARRMWERSTDYPFAPLHGDAYPDFAKKDETDWPYRTRMRAPRPGRPLVFPYAVTSPPSAFRSKKHDELYIDGVIMVLAAFIAAASGGFNIGDFLDWREGFAPEGGLAYGVMPLALKTAGFPGQERFLPHLLGLELDEGSRRDAVFAQMLKIMQADVKAGGFVCETLLSGLLHSHRDDAITAPTDMVYGKGPLTGRDSELFEYVVLNVADRGTLPAFSSLLEPIVDDCYIRLEVLEKVFVSWSGLSYDGQFPRDALGEWAKARRCIKDDAFRAECLTSSNILDIAPAVWACGVNELDIALEAIAKLAERDDDAALLPALYYAAWIDAPDFQERLDQTLTGRQFNFRGPVPRIVHNSRAQDGYHPFSLFLVPREYYVEF